MNEVALPYADRREAGRVLASRLLDYRGRAGVMVLALPRGGVAVAFEVAQALQAPLDVLVVRKLGLPGHEEFAMGAIASGGVCVLNPVPGLDVPAETLESVTAREQAELARREQLYRGGAAPLALQGRVVIVVDDGLATGSTMQAAVLAIRRQRPARLVVAVPVGAAETVRTLQGEADEVVCPAMPEPFHAVGLWYRDFPQASDEEVRQLLAQARREQGEFTH